MNYKDIPLNDRIERIGELLAKAVYLYKKQEKQMNGPNPGQSP